MEPPCGLHGAIWQRRPRERRERRGRVRGEHTREEGTRGAMHDMKSRVESTRAGSTRVHSYHMQLEAHTFSQTPSSDRLRPLSTQKTLRWT